MASLKYLGSTFLTSSSGSTTQKDAPLGIHRRAPPHSFGLSRRFHSFMAKVCLFRCRFGLGGTKGSPRSPAMEWWQFGGALRLSPLRFRSPGPLPNNIPPPTMGLCVCPPSPPMPSVTPP